MPTLLDRVPDALAPTDHIYPWEWAEQHCVITSASGLETGPYRYDRAPYLRGISEALSPVAKDSRGEWTLNLTKRVVVQKAAQVGCSYAALHWLGCMMLHHPAPMLVVGPSEDYCRRLSQLKLRELLTTTPPLQDKVRQAKESRFGQERLAFYFPDGSLLLAGGNSGADLRQVSARFALIDDFDGCPDSVGVEGSLLGLVEGRLSSFGATAKVALISSPTIKHHSKIETAYLASDQRKWTFPCPRCAAWVGIEWANIKFDSDKPAVPVTYQCPSCLEHSTEPDVKRAMQRGAWVAAYPGRAVAGFHVSALMCAWVPWRQLVDEWADAQTDATKLQTFINLRLGQTWERARSTEQDATVRDVLHNRRDYDASAVPDLAFVTCGVDVQGDRLECLVEAWDKTGAAWFLHHHVLRGDPSVTEGMSVWAELGERLQAANVLACGLDSGGQITGAIYDAALMVQELYSVKVFVLKGASGPRPSFVPQKRSDSTLVVAPRTNRRVELWVIDTNRGKEEIATALRRHDRHYRLPHTSTEFVKQLFSEERTEKIVGGTLRVVYVKPTDRTRNEALDCSVYSLAARDLLRVCFGPGFTPATYRNQGVPRGAVGGPAPRPLSLRTPASQGGF